MLYSRARGELTHITLGSHHATRTGKGSKDAEEAPEECCADEGEGQGPKGLSKARKEELNDRVARERVDVLSQPFQFLLNGLFGQFRHNALNRLLDALFGSGSHNVIRKQRRLL